MQQNDHQTCADCGAPSVNLLCERCAEICDLLTPSGEYYAYRMALRSGRIQPLMRRPAPGSLSGLTPLRQSGHG